MIKPGWHINSHIPMQKDLIATELLLNDNAKGWKLESMIYPEAIQKKMVFQRNMLALYLGRVWLQGMLIKEKNGGMLLPVKLTLQACNDQYCLASEQIQMNIPVAKMQ